MVRDSGDEGIERPEIRQASRIRVGADERRLLLEAARASAAPKATPGPDAARSQDFLYGDDGLPQ